MSQRPEVQTADDVIELARFYGIGGLPMTSLIGYYEASLSGDEEGAESWLETLEEEGIARDSEVIIYLSSVVKSLD